MKTKKAISKVKGKMQKGGGGCMSACMSRGEKVVSIRVENPTPIPNPIYVPVTQTPVVEFEQPQSFTLFLKVPNATATQGVQAAKAALDKAIDYEVATITANIFKNVTTKQLANQAAAANEQNKFLNLPDLVMANIIGELLKNKVVNASGPENVEKLKSTCKSMYDYANENKAFVQSTAEDVNKQQISVIKSALQTHITAYLTVITPILQTLRKEDESTLGIYPIITIKYGTEQYSLIYSFSISMNRNTDEEVEVDDNKRDELYNFDLMIGNGLEEFFFENAATCKEEGEKPLNIAWNEFVSDTVSDYIVSNMTINDTRKPGTLITTPVIMPECKTDPRIILTNISIDSIKFICSIFDHSANLKNVNAERVANNVIKLNKKQLIPLEYINELKTTFLDIFRKNNLKKKMPETLRQKLQNPGLLISESIATIMTIADWVSKKNIKVVMPGKKGGKLIKPVFFEKREISGRLRNIYKQSTKLVIKHNGVFIKLSEYKALLKKTKK